MGLYDTMVAMRKWLAGGPYANRAEMRLRTVLSRADLRRLGRDDSRYTAGNLPAIRARKGVGRPPRPQGAWPWPSLSRCAQADHVNRMADGGHFLKPRWIWAMIWAPPARDFGLRAISSTAVLRKSKRRKGRAGA